METISRYGLEALQYLKKGIPPGSEKGQTLAKMVWKAVHDVTGGDENIIAKLAESMETVDSDEVTNHFNSKQIADIATAHEYMLSALDVYLNNIGMTR